jgi:hypothetical protein
MNEGLKMRKVCAFYGFIFLALTATSAQAYEAAGAKWSARNRPVGFAVNPTDAPAGFEAAVRAAAKTWSSVSSLDFEYEYQGQTRINRSALNDGVHAVYYSPGGGGQAATTLATTKYWTQGSQLVHFDIIFNGRHRWSVNPDRSQIDLETVALHEFGHALGLGHSSQWQAVMYPSVNPGTTRRALSTDDIAGARVFYPRNNSSSSNPGAVRLIAPTGSITAQRPQFRWRETNNTKDYSLQVDALDGNGGSRSVLRINKIKKRQYTPGSNLAKSQNYSWRVTAHSPSGATRQSDPQLFTIVGAIPAKPVLVSPVRVKINNRSPLLKWNAVAEATQYQVWVNQVNGKNGLVKVKVSGNQFKIKNRLPRGSYYYWWVRAINSSGNSDWSGQYFFVKRN